jgi:hypothetical protein
VIRRGDPPKTQPQPSLGGRGELKIAWLVLGCAMVGSGALILSKGSGLGFSGDDLFYYARLIDKGGALVSYQHLSPDYILAPHNGHLQAGGRLLYEGIFGVFGPNYAVFRILNTAGFLLCAGLFFEFARRRIGPLAALPLGVLLLFFGFAWEAMLWAFDLHTVFALAFGLGALLTLERDDRTGDAVACLLLVLSIATIEVGLAFLVGVAVAVLIRPDRLRRAWIFLIPLALYVAWSLWARQFHQSQADLSNLSSVVTSVANSASAVMGSLAGRNATGAAVFPSTVGYSAWGWALAGLAAVALVMRIIRGRVPSALWVTLATLLAYWSFIAVAGRSPDSSRYMLVGGVGVLLLPAAAAEGGRVQLAVVGILFAIVALAIPGNIAKLNDGRRYQLSDGEVGRTEYAMLELASEHVNPGYKPSRDRATQSVGPVPLVGLSAGQYLPWAGRRGSIGYSLAEIRDQDEQIHQVADVVLADALRLGVRPSGPPRDLSDCQRGRPKPGKRAVVDVPRGGALMRSVGGRSLPLEVRRFANTQPNVGVGRVPARGWAKLRISADAASDTWQALTAAPIEVCPLRG